MEKEKIKMHQVANLAMRGESLAKISELSSFTEDEISGIISNRMPYSAYLQFCKQRKIVDLLIKSGKSVGQIINETQYTADFVNQIYRFSPIIKQKEEMRTFNATPYNDSEISKMIKMKMEGRSDEEIGKAVGRTAGAISVKMSVLRKEGKLTKGKTQTTTSKQPVPIAMQVAINKMWALGKSKQDIASEIGVTEERIKEIWDSIPGLPAAHDKFMMNVMELYSEGKETYDIAKELKEASLSRIEEVLKGFTPNKPAVIEQPKQEKEMKITYWTDKETTEFVKGFNSGMSCKQLAEKFDRKEQAIYDKLARERKRGAIKPTSTFGSKAPVVKTVTPKKPVTSSVVYQAMVEPLSTPVAEPLAPTTYDQPAQIKVNAIWGESPASVEPASYSNPIVVHVNESKEFNELFAALAKIDREIVIHL